MTSERQSEHARRKRDPEHGGSVTPASPGNRHPVPPDHSERMEESEAENASYVASHLPECLPFKNKSGWADEMTQWLRTHAALAED